MRLREVKKEMKVEIYRMLSPFYSAPFKNMVGSKGVVQSINENPDLLFPVTVKIEGIDILFSHKELKKVK